MAFHHRRTSSTINLYLIRPHDICVKKPAAENNSNSIYVSADLCLYMQFTGRVPGVQTVGFTATEIIAIGSTELVVAAKQNQDGITRMVCASHDSCPSLLQSRVRLVKPRELIEKEENEPVFHFLCFQNVIAGQTRSEVKRLWEALIASLNKSPTAGLSELLMVEWLSDETSLLIKWQHPGWYSEQEIEVNRCICQISDLTGCLRSVNGYLWKRDNPNVAMSSSF